MDISQPCVYCQNDNESHSFYLLSTLPNVLNKESGIFRTQINQAKLYNQPYTIIYHIEQLLKYHKAPQMSDWVWVIDFDKADIKHYLAFRTVKVISKWINEQRYNLCSNLKEIKVCNGNFMLKPMVALSHLFLPSHIKVSVL